MRLINLDGRLAFLLGDKAVDVEKASAGQLSSDPNYMFEQWEAMLDLSQSIFPSSATPFDRDKVRTPIEAPKQIFAVALNYKPHAAEAGYTAPDQPLIFTKFVSSLTGAYAEVPLPEGNVDWEVELVAVVGKYTYKATAAEGWDSIAALTVGQDLSERVSQLAGRPAQFSLGKSFPGFGPVGPALVSVDEVQNRDNLEVKTVLSGQTMQLDRTSNMIFPVNVLVEFLSATCPLYPGDLIFTGTPAGVGNRMDPQRFIQPDDVLVTTIEGIGEMVNTFR